MVEVFKTNVKDPVDAQMLLSRIHSMLSGYNANFDLQDCDKILRIEIAHGVVEAAKVMDLLARDGFSAEVLPDSVPVVEL